MDIQKETFKQMGISSKLDVIYDYLDCIHKRIEKLEKRKFKHSFYAFCGGIIGGIAAVFSFGKIFFK